MAVTQLKAKPDTHLGLNMAPVRHIGDQLPRLLLGKEPICYIGHGLSEAVCILNVLYGLRATAALYLCNCRIFKYAYTEWAATIAQSV